MTSRAVCSVSWNRCRSRRSASVSCIGTILAAVFGCGLVMSVGDVRGHGEDTASGERETDTMLHVGRNALVQLPEQTLRNRAVLGGEDLGGAEADVRLDGRHVLQDPPAEDAPEVQRVVNVDGRQARAAEEQHPLAEITCVVVEAYEQGDGRGKVAKGVHPTG